MPLTNYIYYAMLFFMVDIKAIRKRLGLTQEEIAQKLGVSWVTIARWEAGKSKPSKLAQKAIAFLLKEIPEEGIPPTNQHMSKPKG